MPHHLVIRSFIGASLSLMGCTALVPAAVAQQAQFRPVSGAATATQATVAPGSYGGGLIEALMTGRDPSCARGAAIYNRPQTPTAERYGEALYGADPMTGRSIAPARHQMAAAQAAGADYQRPVEKALDPRWQMQSVDYTGPHRTGTVIIDTPNRFLYLVQPGGKALRYGIGVGRPGFSWAGVKTITRKAEWPDWRPPPEMLKRRPDLPRHMAGGPENPMGARGLYLGSSLYRIHGTNEPHTIGQAVSSGCIRMTNDDVTDLYGRVGVGTRVIVM
jgi:lipoprotein-anchoring transpeptidase ErfK/SrfK